jgi:hypothetical protein
MKKWLPEALVIVAIIMVTAYGFAQAWTQTFTTSHEIDALALSADGKIAIAVGSELPPLVSIDSGTTWTTNATSKRFNIIACRQTEQNWWRRFNPVPAAFVFRQILATTGFKQPRQAPIGAQLLRPQTAQNYLRQFTMDGFIFRPIQEPLGPQTLRRLYIGTRSPPRRTELNSPQGQTVIKFIPRPIRERLGRRRVLPLAIHRRLGGWRAIARLDRKWHLFFNKFRCQLDFGKHKLRTGCFVCGWIETDHLRLLDLYFERFRDDVGFK